MRTFDCKVGRAGTRTGALLLLLLALAGNAVAQQVRVSLDPEQTKINISVHDVHGGFKGSFKLKSGMVIFDRSTGNASGEIVVDAKSGDTGNEKRNRKMNAEVLESDRYPEIVFFPKRVMGEVATQGQSNVQVHGIFRIHGADHDLTLPMSAQVSTDKVVATGNFSVPYESWGMKNPTVLFLRVDGNSDVTVSAEGRITMTPATH